MFRMKLVLSLLLLVAFATYGFAQFTTSVPTTGRYISEDFAPPITKENKKNPALFNNCGGGACGHVLDDRWDGPSGGGGPIEPPPAVERAYQDRANQTAKALADKARQPAGCDRRGGPRSPGC
jgi:hypothetical protein